MARLTQRDFTVRIDKDPSAITRFAAVETGSSAPSEMILLLDTVNEGATNVAYARQQVERFLRRDHGKLNQPTRLVILSDTGHNDQPEALRGRKQVSGHAG